MVMFSNVIVTVCKKLGYMPGIGAREIPVLLNVSTQRSWRQEKPPCQIHIDWKESKRENQKVINSMDKK